MTSDTLPAPPDTLLAVVRWYVARVDRLAEADIMAGNPLTGAHYRAMRRVLKECESGLSVSGSVRLGE